jgi:hypothetical protein
MSATLEIRLARSFRAVIAVWFGCLNHALEGRSVPDSHKRLMTFFRWAAKDKYGDGELRVRWKASAKGQSRGVVRA